MYFYAYSRFLKETFGYPVRKISVDAGLSCPNRDGTKGHNGCAYCDVGSFRPHDAKPDLPLSSQVLHLAEKELCRRPDCRFLIYLQSYTNTYGSIETLNKVYRTALGAIPERTIGLAIGTRPDCLSDEVLTLLFELSRKHYIGLEIGLESIYNRTLTLCGRGHTVEDFFDSLSRITEMKNKIRISNEKFRIDVCVHVIFGLPGESRTDQLAYANVLNMPGIHSIKLHNLHLVKNTLWGGMHGHTGMSKPGFSNHELYSLEAYADFLCEFIPLLRKDLVIQRLFAHCPAEKLIAPEWPGFPHGRVMNYIRSCFARSGVRQGACVQYKGLGVPDD